MSKLVKSISLSLPFPPTVNTYWRRVGARYFISGSGMKFRADVAAELMSRGSPRMDGPLEAIVIYHPPDRRVRDHDNFGKALWDSLAHAGLFVDDSLIKKASYEILERVDGREGWTEVHIRTLGGHATARHPVSHRASRRR